MCRDRDYEELGWMRRVAGGLCLVCGAMLFGGEVCRHDDFKPCRSEERPHPEVMTGRETQNRMPVVYESELTVSVATSTGIDMNIPPSVSNWTIARRG
jgi:hypothetical protein